MTDRELLRLHIEAVWHLALPPLDETVDEIELPHASPPWALYLGVYPNTELALWRANTATAQRSALLAHAHQAGVTWEQALGMRREVVHAPATISPARREQAERLARVLGPADADLVNAFEAESAAYFLNPHMAPCVGVVAQGRLVSIAHSSRQTASACELGINTLPDARRQGYATAAVTLWTALTHKRGLTPIYSAFAWNTASLRLARAVGYEPRIEGVYGPVPERDE